MIKIRIKIYAILREELGWKEKVMEMKKGSTLRDLLNEIPELKKLIFSDNNIHENYRIFINGRYIGFLSGIDSELKNGDIIAIFPAMAGGSLLI